MKTKRVNNAVSEIIGTMLLLGISVSLFSVVYISVLTVPYTPPTPSVNIICQIDDDNIILSHYGGKALNFDSEIVLTVDGQPVDPILAGDYLYNDFNGDGLWSAGEKVVFSYESLVSGGEQLEVNILDTRSNSLVMTGTFSVLSIFTSVDTINPYELTSSPFDITATGSLNLDNVTLYYRWSDDNSSWDNISGISDETKDAVDSNTCDVDSNSDVGSETNFANAQDTAPDSDVMNIQESDTGSPAADINEWLDADGHTEATTEWDTHTNNGDPEYVTAADDDIATHSGSYIREAKDASQEERIFSFENTAETGSGFTVNISIRMATEDGANNDGFNLYYDKTGAGSSWSSAIEYEATAGTNGNPVYAYTTHTLPETLTATEINNLVIYLDTHNDGGGDDRWVDHIRMGIYKAGASNTNYTIDREYQWTSAVNDKTNGSVCIYVDSHTGSENLYVKYRNGASWTNLGTINSMGWNNFSATGLISSTYTIQLIGATESSDSIQDNWDIDCICLRTWNYTGGPDGWIKFGTDTFHPWNWSFDFPIGIGYYQFYSIGQKLGLSRETAPAFSDAICKKI